MLDLTVDSATGEKSGDLKRLHNQTESSGEMQRTEGHKFEREGVPMPEQEGKLRASSL